MQSLMGDRLLKWFLNSSRRRFRRTSSERAESKSESEGALPGLPGRTSDDSTKGVVQSQSESKPQSLCGEPEAPDELDSNNEFLTEEAVPAGSDDMEGYKS